METTNNPKDENQVFRINVKETVNVGTEGPKFMADLYDENGYVGKFFLKRMRR